MFLDGLAAGAIALDVLFGEADGTVLAHVLSVLQAQLNLPFREA